MQFPEGLENTPFRSTFYANFMYRLQIRAKGLGLAPLIGACRGINASSVKKE